ncbi:YafY family protein [Actinomyces slackii]|uniref:Proteasome accessory factor B n=1 Tax=Actinomyces slackii TaxID=52774 RepID=A0A3S4SL37_9ACTO|nr:Proteasome accessory factor B [Actinomyces slackii]
MPRRTRPAPTLGAVSEPTRSAEERLVNLVLSLRNTETGMSAAEIIEGVAGYAAKPASARRMLERDKEMLRDLGIELSTSGPAEEPRYRIEEGDYALAPLHLDAAQAAALDLAASAWRHGTLPATARRALTKLRAVTQRTGSGPDSQGPAPEEHAVPSLSADLAGEQIPEALVTAVDERRLVAFDYASAHSGTRRARTVEPHHLRMSEGAWYLEAVEAGRRRTFRLARIIGRVTPLGRAGAFRRSERVAPEPRSALLAIMPGRALALRLAGRSAQPSAAGHVSQVSQAAVEGRDVVAVDYTDPFSFAGALAGLGPAVIVLEPAELREAVVEHLRGAARACGGER